MKSESKKIRTEYKSSTNIIGLLGIVFVTLKLCGVIEWSWWYVTMPFWGGLALVFVVFVIGAICYLAYLAIKK